LQHLTWQTQQVAKGDYRQRVEFMGNFSMAFNTMVQQLEERRKIEADAKYTLQQYVNLLLSNSQEIILLFDVEGKLVFTSKSYLRHRTAEDPETLQGKSFRELFASVASGEFVQRMEELFQISIADKYQTALEQEIALTQGGGVRHYHIQVIPMLDETHLAVGTMLFFIDMTESIRAQQEAEHARKLAEQSARVKSEFLSRMSHEMRTPMNAIIGMTTVAKGCSSDPERVQHCLAKIHDASQHLLGVINDILDMSKIGDGKFKLSLKKCSLARMVQQISGIVAFRIAERKQMLLLGIDEDLPASIISDEQRLTQVIVNLLDNAIKFTPEQGVISLAVKMIAEKDGICTLRFTVQDTGIGIPEEQREHLFEMFEQADGGFSRKFGGAGIGLAICKGIVDIMDGHIWVESELGTGSSFIFEIKAKTDTEASPQPSDAAPIGETLLLPSCGGGDGQDRDSVPAGRDPLVGKRVLVVEDVEINREIIASLLEDSGLELGYAVDGADALAKFSAAPDGYDLILMDIHMPEMDGFEATRRIRASGLQGAVEIPIVAMTANTFREDIEQCLAAGMNSHLGKPIDLGLLLAELRKYLG
jgi:PAS domain S-box-containing protein